MKYIVGLFLLFFVGLDSHSAGGEKRTSSPDLEVVPRSALPSAAQQPAQDLLLYSSHFCKAWLYVEQEQGARLVVFDVSEPSRIRFVATVSTGAGKPFDLLPVPHKHYAIVRFHDGSGDEMLDLSRPRAPRLTAARFDLAHPSAGQDERDYPGIELLNAANATGQSGDGQDLQILEADATPQLIATVPHVVRHAFRPETGTLFLAGEQGLVVVRQHSAELTWELSFFHDWTQD